MSSSSSSRYVISCASICSGGKNGVKEGGHDGDIIYGSQYIHHIHFGTTRARLFTSLVTILMLYYYCFMTTTPLQ